LSVLFEGGEEGGVDGLGEIGEGRGED
jgi:hypothetical protein